LELLPRSPLDLRVGPALRSPVVQLGSAKPGTSVAAGAAAAAAGAASAREDISTLSSRLGEPVVISGLVVDAEGGHVAVDDGTGRVRLGGKAAAESISLLEPGDAVEVGGQVQRDAAGWLIDVDPGSIVALSSVGDPAGPDAAGPGAPGPDAPGPGAPAMTSRPADRAATLQPVPLASAFPGLAAVLVVVVTVLAAGFAGAFALRHRGWRAAWPARFRRLRLSRNRASEGPQDAP
jgi:hypothetical protein